MYEDAQHGAGRVTGPVLVVQRYEEAIVKS